MFTYSVTTEAEEEETLVLLIRDNAGEMVREMELESDPGLTRVAWDLRAGPAEASDDEDAGSRARGRNRRGPLVEPGRYEAVLGWKVGDDVVEVGEARSFHVIGVQW